MNKPQFAVGDRVAFSRRFLQSIADYSHSTASMRGSVVELVNWPSSTMARIRWDDGSGGKFYTTVNVRNLVSADAIHKESA